MNQRKNYVGTYADFASKITDGTHSDSPSRDQIISDLHTSKEDFYKRTFAVIEDLETEAKIKATAHKELILDAWMRLHLLGK